MAAYCGSIGSVNVLEFVSTDLFDESQENPYLLQQQQQQQQQSYGGSQCYASPAKPKASPPRSPAAVKHQSVRFAELPLSDAGDSAARSAASPSKAATWSPQGSPAKRFSAAPPVVVPTPLIYAPPPLQPRVSFSASSPPPPPAAVSRPSITISLPYPLFQRQSSDGSTASTAATQPEQDALSLEEAELHKLLYSLSRLGLGQQQPGETTPSPPPAARVSFHQPAPAPYQQQASSTNSAYFQQSYASTASAPTSPAGFSSSSLWRRPQDAAEPPAYHQGGSAHRQPTGTASLMFRSMSSRPSRRMTSRQSSKMRRFSSAPSSPSRGDEPSAAHDGFFPSDAGYDQQGEGYGLGGSPPHAHSRGSVTFLTVKNLLRGGGALARTVRREQPNRRPTCMGTELTISSRLKRREKFQRPTVITDAYHRVSAMKLGTSPMKVKTKHLAFPQMWAPDDDPFAAKHDEADAGMPSPKGQLRRESLVTLETLDKIGTRHACPVQLIEEPLPDFSGVAPRVDAWNHYPKPKSILRRPSAWLLGATATSTPRGLHD